MTEWTRKWGPVWEWEKGFYFDRYKWGIAVMIEATTRNRVGFKLRVGPFVVWCWMTSVYKWLEPKRPLNTGTPLLFGQPVGTGSYKNDSSHSNA